MRDRNRLQRQLQTSLIIGISTGRNARWLHSFGFYGTPDRTMPTQTLEITIAMGSDGADAKPRSERMSDGDATLEQRYVA